MKNNLKYKSHIISVFTAICFSLLMLSSCDNKDESSDTTPPAQVSDITFKPNNGGGTFYFKVPQDEDILYVKAVYTLDNNKTIYRASSFYSDSLSIEGLGSEKPYDVEILSVDRSGNESSPIVQKITPLKPAIDLVLSTTEIIPSFSSVFVRWANELRKNVVIQVTYNVQSTTIIKKYSSNILKDNLLIDNLEDKAYNFSVSIEDNFENFTKQKSFSNITPFTDKLIDKSKFRFLRDELMPDEIHEAWEELDAQGNPITMTRTLQRGEKEGAYNPGNEKNWNAKEQSIDGRIQNFWDGIIDDGFLENKNFFSTGREGSIPFSYYIDIGQEIKMSRFRVWQRDWHWDKIGQRDQTGYYYRLENVDVFELWISNDKVNWERVRRFRIVEPSDPIEARAEAVAGHHFITNEENPQFTKPFRYLEYRGLSHFQGNNGVCNASEISIYGTSN